MQSTRAGGESAGGRGDEALDAFAAMVRAFGAGAQRLERGAGEEIAEECERWSRWLLLGPDRNDPGSERRSFVALQRFLVTERRREVEELEKALGELRSAIESIAATVVQAVRADRRVNAVVKSQVDHLADALGAGDVDVLRRSSEVVVSVVRAALESRHREQTGELSRLSKQLDVVKSELTRVREEAQIDALTQVFNRRALDAQIARAARLGPVLGSAPVLLLVDVDHFKRVNDEHGHPAGDEVLKSVAKQLVRSFLRKEDFVARFGGEEFAVVLADCDPAHVAAMGERIRQAIEKMVTRVGVEELTVTVSVGVAQLEAGETEAEWVARTDAALYEAKHAGRNRVVASVHAGFDRASLPSGRVTTH